MRKKRERAAFSDIAKLQKLIDVFHAVDHEMSLNTLRGFLAVARHEGSTSGEIAEIIGVSQSTGSRLADLMGTHGRGGKKGAGLIERGQDPNDRRRTPLVLTDKGVAVLSQAAAALH